MKERKFWPVYCLVCIMAIGIVSALVGCEDPINTEPDPADKPGRGANYNRDTRNIEIIWDAVPGAAKYEVYRAMSRLSPAGAWAMVATVTAKADEKEVSFIDYRTLPAGSRNQSARNTDKYDNYYTIKALDAAGTLINETKTSLEMTIFGPTVHFYSPYDDMTAIQDEINNIHDTITLGNVDQGSGRRGEFSSRRFGFFFKPGEYSFTDTLKIGFNTSMIGLGRLPTDTVIGGSINTPAHLGNNNATCTFFRSIENLEIDGEFRWGVSQAAPMRRMYARANTFFTVGGWVSGGFSADSWFNNTVDGGGGQQWYVRNSHFVRNFNGITHNKVVQGITADVAMSNIVSTGMQSSGQGTVIENSPIIREKPFLFIDMDGEYKVFVPALRSNTTGITWDADAGSMGLGTEIDFLNNFYVATARVEYPFEAGISHSNDNAAAINAKLNAGKHIFFAPGIMECEAPIQVSKANTIVLGQGYPTLHPKNSNGALFVADVPGVTIAGIMMDATDSHSAYLLTVGETGSNKDHSANPTLIADITLRVGGYFLASEGNNNVHADVSVLINSNNVIGDHFWIWRADHGNGAGIGWRTNTSKNGTVVMGNDVTMYGLFVEHHHEYVTLWLGERGQTFFYQNESPYDPPNQDLYRSHNNTVDGWAMYKVANKVNEHLGMGIGMYPCLTRVGGNEVHIQNPGEVPHKPGVRILNALTFNLGPTNTGGLNTSAKSIINGTGNANTGAGSTTYLKEFVDGVGTLPNGRNSNGIEPEDEEHWVEYLIIDNRGNVTANPYGGRKSVSGQ